MCAGSHLANRELFVAFARLILAFEILRGSNWDERCTHPVDYNGCKTALVAESRDFYIKLRVRDGMSDLLDDLKLTVETLKK
jgi:phenylacetate 2-hydroxylase